MTDNTWVLYAIICAGLWGSGYTLLSPVSKQIPSDIISITYGASLFLVNILYNILTYRVEAFYVIATGNVGLYLFGYITFFVIANFIYLKGNSLATEQSANGSFTAICSIYPMITMILSYIFLNQRNLNFAYVIPGMLLILCGLILLVVGKSHPSS
jgi:hypothetical protein